jgi:hypothetical protein
MSDRHGLLTLSEDALEADWLELAHELGITGRRAGNQLYARCPLHRDRSPSFTLSVTTGQWTCHVGCGPATGRSFVKLVELVLGLSPAEARTWVRVRSTEPDVDSLTGKIVAALNPEAEAPVPVDLRWRVTYDGCGDEAMPLSFLRRGFSWETIKEWGIRYDPEDERVLIPVLNEEAEFVGTVGWTARPGVIPKYRNSPGLTREHLLFGFHSSWEGGTVILVEGVLDAVWLQAHGYKGAAIFGDTLTPGQVSILQKRRIENVILAFDNDKAGRQCTAKAAPALFEAGWMMTNIYEVDWPRDLLQDGKPRIKDFQDATQNEIEEILKTTHYALI